MKRQICYSTFAVLLICSAIFISSCNNSTDFNGPFDGINNSSNSNAFMSIAEKNSSVNSFTPNYNEEQAMAMAEILAKDIYPIRIGQKMELQDKSLILVKDSTTALGTLVQKYQGTMIISGSFQVPTIGINSRVDTTITKTFYTTITRMIEFKKVGHIGVDSSDWKITAVSLPNGGTTGDNIIISKLTLTTQDGTEVVIDSPNTYFFKVGAYNSAGIENEDNDNHGFEAELNASGHLWKNLLTWYRKNQPVTLTLEILSKSSDPDYLTLTYGAMMNGSSRIKNKFNLVSSTQEGIYYRKVYECNWNTHSNSVRMHAVINALTRTSVYDTNSAIEEKTWGIPYRVR